MPVSWEDRDKAARNASPKKRGDFTSSLLFGHARVQLFHEYRAHDQAQGGKGSEVWFKIESIITESFNLVQNIQKSKHHPSSRRERQADKACLV